MKHALDQSNPCPTHQIRPWLSVTCDMDNLFNEPIRRYRGVPDQLQFFSIIGTTVTIGLNGRF